MRNFCHLLAGLTLLATTAHAVEVTIPDANYRYVALPSELGDSLLIRARIDRAE